jgi:hypothetical protein
MKSILDPSFRYTPSVSTDLRKTFARIRRMERERSTPSAAAAEAGNNVLRIESARKTAASTPNR